jgi:hypothetical protein
VLESAMGIKLEKPALEANFTLQELKIIIFDESWNQY